MVRVDMGFPYTKDEFRKWKELRMKVGQGTVAVGVLTAGMVLLATPARGQGEQGIDPACTASSCLTVPQDVRPKPKSLFPGQKRSPNASYPPGRGGSVQELEDGVCYPVEQESGKELVG